MVYVPRPLFSTSRGWTMLINLNDAHDSCKEKYNNYFPSLVYKGSS